MTHESRSRTTRRTHTRLATLALTFASALLGCAPDAPTSFRPGPEVLGARTAGSTSVSVSSAVPNYAKQGTVQLRVRVYGAGFSAGAQARWLLGTDSTQVITNATTFISSGELEALITVSSAAPLALYDIAVTNPGGKKGVGVEMFAVTTAEVLGPGGLGDDATVLGMNDLGNAVGYAGSPFVYDGTTMVPLTTGAQPWGIDPSGDVIVGRAPIDSKHAGPSEWLRTAPGSYTLSFLPRPSGSPGGIARKVARAPNGDLVAGGSYGVIVSKTTSVAQPALWRKVGGTWQAPIPYAVPGVEGHPFAVTSSGQMAGWITLSGGGFRAIVWESPTVYTVMQEGKINDMNPAGTLAVGIGGTGGPVFWYRHPVTLLWDTAAIRLPLGAAGCSTATGVNDAGVVVGGGCVWQLDRSQVPPVVVDGPFTLPGLGQPGTGSRDGNPKYVSNTPPYIIIGEASTTPKRLAVRWMMP